MGMKRTSAPLTPLKFDMDKAVKIVKGFVIGAVLKRVDEGRDIYGVPFVPYSAAYVNKLRKMGEDTKVDLRVTSGLMNSIKVRDVVKDEDSARIIIAPDAGTSRSRNPPLNNGKKAKSTVSPPHNILGYYIQNGIGNQPKREFLGLSPDQEAELTKLLVAAKLFS